MQNSTNNSDTKKCMSCCSCLVMVAIIVLMIFDFIQIANYNNLQSQIDNYNDSNCYYTCGFQYYYERNGQCCFYYDNRYCQTKSVCISSLVRPLQYQQRDIETTITILSTISGLLFIVFIILLCICCKQSSRNRVPLLGSQDNWNINQSQNSQKTRKIDTGYESFAHVDQQNSCCICLEQFNNQKAILLKCGHIFHSQCIRDWAVKQQNCPVCRSSQ